MLTKKASLPLGHILLVGWIPSAIKKFIYRRMGYDIGNDVREIIIEDEKEGQIELKWRDINRLELFQAPADITSSFGQPLFGTVVSRDGMEFTGFVCWDVDEVLTEDILDGNDEAGRRRKIAFGNIESIRRNSSSSALVASSRRRIGRLILGF